jgi:3-dehydroquinate synthase
MRELTVNLGKNSYPVLIGEGILDRPEVYKKYINSGQVMIVTNETIAPLYLEPVLRCLGDARVEKVIIPDGEEYKTLETMNDIITRLLQARFSRTCCLIALGGGVVGDITGFAAACYQRGVNYIQVPTTILAQVDSSVGGKTAVNHQLGKNMIGAFYQPRAVITDVSVLQTLNAREIQAGLSEVIKYGLIRDREFFAWLEKNIARLLELDSEALVYAIEKSCRNKAEVVAVDEREAGERALLNLGHTFGHAVETGLGYKDWLHGEAVALGMLMAADLSFRHGWIGKQDVMRIANVLRATELPQRLPGSLDADTMLDLMSVDKKARNGQMHLVLLHEIGKAIVTNDFDRTKLEETLKLFSSAVEKH